MVALSSLGSGPAAAVAIHFRKLGIVVSCSSSCLAVRSFMRGGVFDFAMLPLPVKLFAFIACFVSSSKVWCKRL